MSKPPGATAGPTTDIEPDMYPTLPKKHKIGEMLLRHSLMREIDLPELKRPEQILKLYFLLRLLLKAR